ncbi:MAG: MazG family protein [Caldilineales bacterium]|nr:MazG family protein [Caldilineales bacterium]
MIKIVGLGPGDPELMTRQAWRCLTEANEIWVRTTQHPAIPALAAHTQIHSYDDLYQMHPDFEAVYAAISLDVANRGEQGDMVYAVPGDPTVAEATTAIIRKLAAERNIPVSILCGVSFLEPTLAELQADPITGMQIIDSQTLAASFHPPGSSRQGLMVPQLYSRLLAGDVKLTLMNAYPPDHPVKIISGAGTGELRVRSVALFELDRFDAFDDMTTLWVTPLSRPSEYNDLQEVIARLRAPDGCPWDREQTHASLRSYLLEETYEVLDALDSEDPVALTEELGDLLIQVALHVQIATEEGEFPLRDVIEHVVEKLIRRHPHVFADVDVSDAAEVTRNWEAIKAAERKSANGDGAQKQVQKTLLDGVPTALPSLTLAQSYVERLARVGYTLSDGNHLDEAELGRALLELVKPSQSAGLDAGLALRRAALALRAQLQTVVAIAEARGVELATLPTAAQHELWTAATSSQIAS